MDQGWGRSQGSQGHPKSIQVQDPIADALSQSPHLDSWLAQFLEGEEPEEGDQSAERGLETDGLMDLSSL